MTEPKPLPDDLKSFVIKETGSPTTPLSKLPEATYFREGDCDVWMFSYIEHSEHKILMLRNKDGREETEVFIYELRDRKISNTFAGRT